jgi:hypothetical protein
LNGVARFWVRAMENSNTLSNEFDRIGKDNALRVRGDGFPCYGAAVGAGAVRCRQSLHGMEGCACLRVAAELGFEIALEEQEDGIARILADARPCDGGGALVLVVVGAQILGEIKTGVDGGDFSVFDDVLELANSFGAVAARQAEEESEHLDDGG